MTRALFISALFIAAVSAGYDSASARQAAAVRVARTAPRGGQLENRWRYQWHNDRWWYWTSAQHWSYFDGRRWVRYDPRRPTSGALAAGYRKASAFESPPAAPPQPPRSWSAEGMERETGLPGSYYFEGGPSPFGRAPLPMLGEASATPGAIRSPQGIGNEATYGAPRTGGGAFGGPKGGSLGAGSAAGGASAPQ